MTLQQHRFHTAYSYVMHPLTLTTKMGVPNVYKQSKDLGGSFVRITRGLNKNDVANFSPSIIKHRGHTLIAWRSQPEPFCFRHDMKYFYYNNTPTEINIGQLHEDDTILAARKLRSKPHKLSYEDPRLFITPDDELYGQFVTSSYATKWDTKTSVMTKSPKVCVGSINEFGELVDAVYPPVGGNHVDGKAEKNWCFFSDGDKLRLLYATMPVTIKTPGEADITLNSECLQQVTGGNATFNSTAPIDIGDEWLVFFHWKHMAVENFNDRPYLLYHLGAYCLDKNLTRITRMMKEPMFTGSTNDELITWTDAVGNPVSKQPACILPFGCFEEDYELVMSLGVNDSFMGIFRCDMANILSLMDAV